MAKKISHSSSSQYNDPESTMEAAQDVVGEIFAEASNDERYHKPVSSIKQMIDNGTCSCEPEEIAERILAWSLDL